jgi:hypothetical protein
MAASEKVAAQREARERAAADRAAGERAAAEAAERQAATRLAAERQAAAEQASEAQAASAKAAAQRAAEERALASASPAPATAEEDPRKALPTVSLAGQSSRPRPPVPEGSPLPRVGPAARAEAHVARAPHATEPAHPGEPGRVPITGIGFRPGGGGAVLVRSERSLEYAVSGEGRAVLIRLKGADIKRPNDRLPLDTRFFGGVVERVVPLQVPGGIDLRIELRSPAGYQVLQGDGVLSVTFAPAP